MKYFNPNYWFKLWVLITPIFQYKIQSINTKSIYNEERDWKPKNISVLACIQTKYQDISCIHEAGHAVIILDSKFKNKFQNLEYINSNSKYLGKTISYELVPLNQIKNISDDDLYTLLQINLGGYAAESIFFDNNPLKYIIGQSRIMDSSDLHDYHDTYQKEFESRKLKPHNEDSLSFIGKQLNITRRKINNKPEFEKIIKTCCLINYVNKKHADYILKNKEMPIPLFTKEQIQAFTPEQIQTLTARKVKEFLTTQIPYFEEQQIPWFTTEQIAAFTEKQIPWFTTEQIQALIIQQIKSFSSTQTQTLTPQQIKALALQQISWLAPEQIKSLTIQQIQIFWTWQISWFTEQQIQALTPQQIQSFWSEQISWLTTEQIQAFTPKQISWFTEEQIQALTPQQIQTLIRQQIQTLTRIEREEKEILMNEATIKIINKTNDKNYERLQHKNFKTF